MIDVLRLLHDPLVLAVLQLSILVAVALLVASIFFHRSPACKSCILTSALICSVLLPAIFVVCKCTGLTLAMPFILPDVKEKSLPIEFENAAAASRRSLDSPADEIHQFFEDARGVGLPENFVLGRNRLRIIEEPLYGKDYSLLGNHFSIWNPINYPIVSDSGFPYANSYGESQSAQSGLHCSRSRQSTTEPLRPTLVRIWLIGTVVLFVGLIISLTRLRRFLGSVTSIDQGKYIAEINAAKSNIGVDEYPRVSVTRDIDTPFAAGFFGHSQVILPETFLKRATRQQLIQVLTHEGAHVINHDPLLRLVQRISHSIWWWHPLIYYMNRELSRAREEACDNYVLIHVNAKTYGETLFSLAKYEMRKRPLTTAVGFLGTSWKLEHRIKGILNPRRKTMTQVSKSILTLVLGASIGLATIAGATRIQVQEEGKPLDLNKSPGQSLDLNEVKLKGIDLFLANSDHLRRPIFLWKREQETRDRIRENYNIPIFYSDKARDYPPIFLWPLLNGQLKSIKSKQKENKRDDIWSYNPSLVPIGYTSAIRSASLMTVNKSQEALPKPQYWSPYDKTYLSLVGNHGMPRYRSYLELQAPCARILQKPPYEKPKNSLVPKVKWPAYDGLEHRYWQPLERTARSEFDQTKDSVDHSKDVDAIIGAIKELSDAVEKLNRKLRKLSRK